VIARLAGRVEALLEDALVLDVGGVGYLVFCGSGTLAALAVGDSCRLWIITHVREDHIHLYGFRDLQERAWFTLLQEVQGVGARVAMALLSVLTPNELATAVATQDRTLLTRAPGVGPRLAQRLVSELKDRTPEPLALAAAPAAGAAAPAGGGAAADAVSALVNLGYRQPEALQAVQAAMRASRGEPDVATLIRDGLKELAR
jgi:Holliday junction DNA helicase RuvA